MSEKEVLSAIFLKEAQPPLYSQGSGSGGSRGLRYLAVLVRHSDFLDCPQYTLHGPVIFFFFFLPSLEHSSSRFPPSAVKSDLLLLVSTGRQCRCHSVSSGGRSKGAFNSWLCSLLAVRLWASDSCLAGLHFLHWSNAERVIDPSGVVWRIKGRAVCPW